MRVPFYEKPVLQHGDDFRSFAVQAPQRLAGFETYGRLVLEVGRPQNRFGDGVSPFANVGQRCERACVREYVQEYVFAGVCVSLYGFTLIWESLALSLQLNICKST